MQWADLSLVPYSFIDLPWAPFFGPYRVLIDEGRTRYCAVDALTYQTEVDRKRVFSCAWRAIRPRGVSSRASAPYRVLTWRAPSKVLNWRSCGK
jgi:hypothetical protein